MASLFYGPATITPTFLTENGFSYHNLWGLGSLSGSKEVTGKSLLLLGDSLDRFMLTDWCERSNDYHQYRQRIDPMDSKTSSWYLRYHNPVLNITVIPWLIFPNTYTKKSNTIYTKHPRGYRTIWEQPSRCVDIYTGDNIASVHLYGSASRGPYYYNFSNNQYDSHIDTKPRLDLVLRTYIDKFGLPDRIIFHTIQWDKKYYYDSNHGSIQLYEKDLWTRRLKEYEFNTNLRLNQIISTIKKYKVNTNKEQFIESSSPYGRVYSDSYLSNGQTGFGLRNYTETNGVELGLRTAVWNFDWEAGFIDAMNNMTRKIAFERNLLLYDYDQDVWNLREYNRSHMMTLFRDPIHPMKRLSINAADKLLDRMYSNYMIYPRSLEVKASNEGIYSMEELIKILQSRRIYLIRSQDHVYFIHKIVDYNQTKESFIYGRWDVDPSISIPSIAAGLQLGDGDILSWPNDTAIAQMAIPQGSLSRLFLSSSQYFLGQVKESFNRSSNSWILRHILVTDHTLYLMKESHWNALSSITSKQLIISDLLDSFWIDPIEPFFLPGGDVALNYK